MIPKNNFGESVSRSWKARGKLTKKELYIRNRLVPVEIRIRLVTNGNNYHVTHVKKGLGDKNNE